MQDNSDLYCSSRCVRVTGSIAGLIFWKIGVVPFRPRFFPLGSPSINPTVKALPVVA